jgi:hypothetical protein
MHMADATCHADNPYFRDSNDQMIDWICQESVEKCGLYLMIKDAVIDAIEKRDVSPDDRVD